MKSTAGPAIFAVDRGVSKAVQVLLNGIEAVLVLLLIALKYRSLY